MSAATNTPSAAKAASRITGVLEVEGEARRFNARAVRPPRNQGRSGKALAGEGGTVTALVEAVLQNLVGLQLLGLRLVDSPPEELLALDAGDEAGFGEVGEGRAFLHHDIIWAAGKDARSPIVQT